MSIGGSEKENIFSLFLLRNSKYLEEIIGGKLERIEAEVPVSRKKVDLLAVETNRRLPVYIEAQIKPSDLSHLNTIQEILEFVHEGIIIWIARSFQRQHLEQVISLLKRNKHKYIAFYALEINPDAIAQVERLNQLYKLDIWNQLKRISAIGHPPLKQVSFYSQIPPTHTGRAVESRDYDLTRVEDVKQYILESLRSKVPYYLNVWKSKKHNQGDQVLSLGAGRDGVDFKLSVKNQQGVACIYLYFTRYQLELYNSFKKNIQKFRGYIHPDLTASRRKIGVFFEPDPELEVTISKLAVILERMLMHFGPYLFSGIATERSIKAEPEQLADETDEIRNWVKAGLPGIHPKIAELLLEEVDNEHAYKRNLEQISEYLMHV